MERQQQGITHNYALRRFKSRQRIYKKALDKNYKDTKMPSVIEVDSADSKGSKVKL